MRSGATLLATVLVAAVLGTAAPATADTGTDTGPYRPPVDRAVVDPFRPPPNPYGAGNRGVDYGTEAGEPVAAAADGEVVFAGPVGGGRHVVVLHPDGIRTSYSFLAGVAVARGDHVRLGDVLGTAGGGGLHFGARAGDRYLDPTLLFGDRGLDVHLVPAGRNSLVPGSEADERRGLLQSLAGAVTGVVGWGVDAHLRASAALRAFVVRAAEIGWDLAWQELEDLWTKALVLSAYHQTFFLPGLEAFRAWRRMQPFLASQEGCTPAGHNPPPPPPERRIVVLVGGFGSSEHASAVRQVDTAALGYDAADVVEFDYGPDGSTGDLAAAGRRLRAQLEGVRAAHPGVPVDVIAHSQGGVVARSALGDGSDAFDSRLPRIDNLVTLGSPHHGADIATLNAGFGTTTVGEIAQLLVWGFGGPNGTSVAAEQLAETSAFLDDLAEKPLPPGTRVTSIAARGDLVVPALSSGLEGATNVVVGLAGPWAHSELPGADATTREIALALAGRGPTCRNLAGDLAGAAALSWLEDGLGAALTFGGTWIDVRGGPLLATPAPAPG